MQRVTVLGLYVFKGRRNRNCHVDPSGQLLVAVSVPSEVVVREAV